MKRLDLVLLLLRLILGTIFIAHGMQKLFGVFGGSGIGGFTEALGNMGILLPGVMAWVVALVEFLGGIGLIFGIFPRLSAIGIGLVMVVAILKIHLSQGLFASQGGFEFQLLILGVAIAIALMGAGNFAFFNRY